jgi:serine/threonine protein kinase
MTDKPQKIAPKSNDPIIGQQLGDYTIVSLLGRGGMARVYKGFDARLERYAAVKVIDAILASGSDAPEYRERFHREARSIARLRHPNIVSVYQFGEFNNLYYMAMMFIEGRDLTQVLRDNAQQRIRMSYSAVVRVARDIGAALDYAHREGVIHRDIKPSNIMMTSDGQSILTDFGLALSVPEGSIGNTFGSAHYIAPEQAVASNNAVPQSDLYSLAVVLYQMLAGRVPFDDPSAMSVAIKHLQEPPPPPSVINRELTDAVDAVLLKALHKQPEKRYASGHALAQALERALQSPAKSGTQGQKPAETPAALTGTQHVPDGATMPLPPEVNVTQALPLQQKVAQAPSSAPKPPSSPTHPEIKPLTQGRPAVSPVWAQDLAGEMGSLPRLPTTRKSRRPLVIWAMVGILALAGAGIFLMMNSAAPNVTETPAPGVAQVASATSTDAAPSETAMRTNQTTQTTMDVPPSATATIPPIATTTEGEVQPSATPRRGAGAMATERAMVNLTVQPPEPLVVPTLQATTEGGALPNLLLSYDGDVVTVTNVGTRNINLVNMEFAQVLSDGSERVFRANQWSSGGFNITRFGPGDCVQVWTDAFMSRDAPIGCTRQAWRSVSRPRWFWISAGSTVDFVVRIGDAILATCEIEAGRCEVVID